MTAWSPGPTPSRSCARRGGGHPRSPLRKHRLRRSWAVRTRMTCRVILGVRQPRRAACSTTGTPGKLGRIAPVEPPAVERSTSITDLVELLGRVPLQDRQPPGLPRRRAGGVQATLVGICVYGQQLNPSCSSFPATGSRPGRDPGVEHRPPRRRVWPLRSVGASARYMLLLVAILEDCPRKNRIPGAATARTTSSVIADDEERSRAPTRPTRSARPALVRWCPAALAAPTARPTSPSPGRSPRTGPVHQRHQSSAHPGLGLGPCR